jgi:glyoxylase-like metal-dependent hydrolase (beta-lactamase superfamily II)
MTQAFNAKTKLAARAVGGAEKVADGVWVVRGGFPMKTMNVYLVEEADGLTVFDAGIRQMTKAVAAIGARMGGIKRVVLGHGHADHRGVAAALGVPVLCHPDNRADAEGDGGLRYMDFARLNPLSRLVYPSLLRMWDGGPVTISGTVQEGDEVAGFRVVEIPGHAPGMIALWRESDRVALTSDCFYVVDPQTGRPGPPRVPHEAFNLDTAQARASMRKIAALDPAIAAPGHLGPLTGDVRGELERAAGA